MYWLRQIEFLLTVLCYIVKKCVSNVLQIDAALFGLLAQIVYIPIESPYRDLLKNECKNLIEYCDRTKDRFWPDWNEILIKMEK